MTPDEPTQENEEHFDEEAFWRKVRTVPESIVEKAITLYVLLSSRDTPAWVRALALAALAYLINPLDACPDVLPCIGLIDDLAILVLALERLSRYVTPEVEARAKRLVPRWLAGGKQPTEDENPPGEDPGEHEQGDHDDAEEEEGNEGRGRIRILN